MENKKMSDDLKDKMVLATLLDRFQKQRLPRLLDIRDKVDQGDKLDDYEIEFLDEVFTDARENENYLAAADNDLKELFMKVLSLYKEITQKAMENEQKG